ncbi:MAG TPA: aldo/keto reductase, partial [Polyangiaceae bacterium]|nr:aldo/keto reductase [Polyangiaceae bacterium]
MKQRAFGSTGRKVPVIGLGTWHLDDVEPKAAEAALHAGLELGMLHIDTAEYYGAAVEATVGRVVASR